MPNPKEEIKDWEEMFEGMWYSRLAFPQVDIEKLVKEVKNICRVENQKTTQALKEEHRWQMEQLTKEHHRLCQADIKREIKAIIKKIDEIMEKYDKDPKMEMILYDLQSLKSSLLGK